MPPFFGAPDVTAHYLAFTRPAIAAMKKHGVTRIVTVSGIGRRPDMKAGVVSSALAKDLELERAGLHVRALWCPGFMENMLRSLGTLRSEGAFFGTSRPEVKRPLVATRDIAVVGARLLRDRSWTGPGGVAVLGPEDLSLDDMAEIMSDVLGRPIRYQQVPVEGHKAQLMKYGASEDFAQGLLDMHAEKDRGLDQSEPRTPENTTPTTFREWCTTVLKPALDVSDGDGGRR
ncbi:MAG: NmrA family protein [Myxococcaceae bacterium]|nr:NmrA family protein [Myxococcaceae bacterium]